MPSEARRLYWDSNVFLYYINADAARLPVIEAIFSEVERSKGRIEIVTSTITIIEASVSRAG